MKIIELPRTAIPFVTGLLECELTVLLPHPPDSDSPERVIARATASTYEMARGRALEYLAEGLADRLEQEIRSKAIST